jgi:flagellar basal-body rod protein FlgB
MINNTDNILSFYQKTLEGLWTRNEVISNNIANAESQGYLAKEVNFEDVINEYLTASKGEHKAGVSPDEIKYRIEYQRGLDVKSNGNNVDMEKEMVSLAENQMKYDLASQALKFQLNLLNTVLSESKG